MDKLISQYAKRAWGLPVATPSRLVLEHKDKNGMGIGSLMVDYVQLNAAYLVKALNDHGPLGCTTRSLLKQQHAALGGL